MKKQFVFLFSTLIVLVGLTCLKLFTSPLPTTVDTVEEKVVPEEKPVVAAPKLNHSKLSPRHQEFLELSQTALASLPTIESVRNNSEEAAEHFHGHPKSLVDAAAELGRMADFLDAHPEEVAGGLEFYKKCALREDLLSSVRAVCLHHMKNRAEKTNPPTPVSLSSFPEEILRLSEKL